MNLYNYDDLAILLKMIRLVLPIYSFYSYTNIAYILSGYLFLSEAGIVSFLHNVRESWKRALAVKIATEWMELASAWVELVVDLVRRRSKSLDNLKGLILRALQISKFYIGAKLW